MNITYNLETSLQNMNTTLRYFTENWIPLGRYGSLPVYLALAGGAYAFSRSNLSHAIVEAFRNRRWDLLAGIANERRLSALARNELLMRATSGGYANIVALLLGHEGRISDTFRGELIQEAVNIQNTNILNLLLSTDARIPQESLEEAVLFAVDHEDMSSLEILTTFRPELLSLAIARSSMRGNRDILNRLLSFSEPNQLNENLTTALMAADQVGQDEIILQLNSAFRGVLELSVTQGFNRAVYVIIRQWPSNQEQLSLRGIRRRTEEIDSLIQIAEREGHRYVEMNLLSYLGMLSLYEDSLRSNSNV